MLNVNCDFSKLMACYMHHLYPSLIDTTGHMLSLDFACPVSDPSRGMLLVIELLWKLMAHNPYLCWCLQWLLQGCKKWYIRLSLLCRIFTCFFNTTYSTPSHNWLHVITGVPAMRTIICPYKSRVFNAINVTILTAIAITFLGVAEEQSSRNTF